MHRLSAAALALAILVTPASVVRAQCEGDNATMGGECDPSYATPAMIPSEGPVPDMMPAQPDAPPAYDDSATFEGEREQPD